VADAGGSSIHRPTRRRRCFRERQFVRRRAERRRIVSRPANHDDDPPGHGCVQHSIVLAELDSGSWLRPAFSRARSLELDDRSIQRAPLYREQPVHSDPGNSVRTLSVDGDRQAARAVRPPSLFFFLPLCPTMTKPPLSGGGGAAEQKEEYARRPHRLRLRSRRGRPERACGWPLASPFYRGGAAGARPALTGTSIASCQSRPRC